MFRSWLAPESEMDGSASGDRDGWQLQIDGAPPPFSRDTSASRVKNTNITATFYEPASGTFVAQSRVARQTWPTPPRPGRDQTLEDGYGRKHDSRRSAGSRGKVLGRESQLPGGPAQGSQGDHREAAQHEPGQRQGAGRGRHLGHHPRGGSVRRQGR